MPFSLPKPSRLAIFLKFTDPWGPFLWLKCDAPFPDIGRPLFPEVKSLFALFISFSLEDNPCVWEMLLELLESEAYPIDILEPKLVLFWQTYLKLC